MKLNGWQRLWLVLTVMWLAFWSWGTYDMYQSRVSAHKDTQTNAALMLYKAREINQAGGLEEYHSYLMRRDLIVFASLAFGGPVTLYGIGWVVVWVRKGFHRGGLP